MHNTFPFHADFNTVLHGRTALTAFAVVAASDHFPQHLSDIDHLPVGDFT
jgi:hypothetical protein